jgi:diguanylate cyclase (GGDEF)-like protein
LGSYYTALILVVWMALGVLCILVWENSWIPAGDKRRFYLTYGIIALAAFAEWTGIQLNGNERFPTWLLSLVKCVDYICTPMVGGAVVAQMKLRNRWSRALMILLVGNAVFQVAASFNQWMVVIDGGHHYSHGPLYTGYIILYLLVIALTGVEFLVYGQAYRRQNRASLYSVLLLVVVGIGIQEISGGQYRTAYIALTMGVALMFIHYTEFYQLASDEHIHRQRGQLMTDALSGAHSRYAYMKELEEYRKMAWIPDDLAAFTVDINELKTVNDTVGHDAGDELIVAAARCLEKAVGDAGKCYRTGGDEFVVLARMDKEQAESALQRLQAEANQWKGKDIKHLSLSAGYALAKEHQGLPIEKIIKEADQAMYAAKAEYYRKKGSDRRGPR